MAIDVRSFRVLDDSLAIRLAHAWKAHVRPTVAQIDLAHARGDQYEVDRLIQSIRADRFFDQHERYIRFISRGSLVFGASRVRRVDSRILDRPDHGRGLESLVKIFRGFIETTVVQQTKKDLYQFLNRDLRAQQAEADRQHTTKAEAGTAAFSRELQSFVDDRGQVAFDIGSSLHTSRLSSWGFTGEAEATDVTTYVISEQLDSRTCEICEYMDGQEFQVEDARRVLEGALSAETPEDLKNIAPWPSQDDAGLERFKSLSMDDLVNNGWNVPPYHPYCRGLLLPAEEQRSARPQPIFDNFSALDFLTPTIEGSPELEPILPGDLPGDSDAYHEALQVLANAAKTKELSEQQILYKEIPTGGGPQGAFARDMVERTADQWGALTDDQRNWIRDYTGSLYAPLNKALGEAGGDLEKLRVPQGITYYTTDQLKVAAAELDTALATTERLDDLVLWRAANVSHYGYAESYAADEIRALGALKGEIFQDPAFGSTTTSYGVARAFIRSGRLVMRIKAPKGGPGMWVGGSDTRGFHFSEWEMVLPRGLYYRIDGVLEVPFGSSGQVYPVLDVTLVEPPKKP